MNMPELYKPQPKRVWKITLLIVGICFVLSTAFISYTQSKAYNQDVKLNNHCKAAPQEMIKSGDIYKFENAAVLNYYAATNFESATSNQCHFIIGYFEDEKDTTVHLASITLTKNDGEILNTMFDYSESEEIENITFFAKAESISKLDDEVYDYYKEDVEYFNEHYSNVIDSGLCLDYCFDDESQFENYRKMNEKKAGNSKTTTVIMLIIGAVLIILGIPKRRRSKKQYETVVEPYYSPSEEI